MLSIKIVLTMASLNKNEYGKTVYANLGEDISAYTELKFILEPKVGVKLEKSVSDGVAIGASNITVDDESYLANQYISYTIQTGDLDRSGQWRIKGEATLSNTNKAIGDYKIITVLD